MPFVLTPFVSAQTTHPWGMEKCSLSIFSFGNKRTHFFGTVSPLENWTMLKLQYFGHLMRRVDSLEKKLLLGRIGGRRRRKWQRMRWLDGFTDLMDMSWVNSGSWWWTGRPGVLIFMGSQRVRHDWATELNQMKLHIFYVLVDGLVTRSYSTLATPWTVTCQAPLSMVFSRQEYWSRLSFPSPGDLPNLGIEPTSPALQADSLLTELWVYYH